MSKTYRQSLGSWGERVAARYLQENGYTILDQNVRTAYGEIDLVALQQSSPDMKEPGDETGLTGEVVFVEVKTRASSTFGLPEEAVTTRKKAHLLSSAQAYLQVHPELTGAWRIDVIAIRRQRSQSPEILHFENAVV
jgi:putative endonuclease